MNILISSAGRRVILVREFRKALRRLKISGNVVAIDISNTAPALYAADRAFVVPGVCDKEFPGALFEIVKKEKIDLILPTIDPELPVYARLKGDIEARTGARVAVSSPEVVDICMDKYKSFQFLSSIPVPTPHTFTRTGILPADISWPLFAKPRCGFASVNTFTVGDREEFEYLAKKYPDLIFQEHIQGKEYTVDLLSDFKGQVIHVVPRERLEVRAGEVTRSRTERNYDIMASARTIAEKLGSTGPITLQCLLREGIPYFFEINPRVGGGIVASIAAGANTPLLLLQMRQGRHIRPRVGRFRDNHYMLRYDDALYETELLPGGIDTWRKK